ncbi:hypothetical protein C0J52_26389, partial [Blattella germanica]
NNRRVLPAIVARERRFGWTQVGRHSAFHVVARRRMECQKAARRFRHILRSAERLDVTLQDVAALPGAKKLLSRRGSQDKNRVLHTLLPVACTALVLALYCYCSLHSSSQQTIAGKSGDLTLIKKYFRDVCRKREDNNVYIYFRLLSINFVTRKEMYYFINFLKVRRT